jgi:hypothetical protein
LQTQTESSTTTVYGVSRHFYLAIPVTRHFLLNEMMFGMEEGAKVWAPSPEGDGEIRAVFLAIAVGEPITVEGIDRDAAWISYEEGDDEGATGRVPFYKLRRRDE